MRAAALAAGLVFLKLAGAAAAQQMPPPTVVVQPVEVQRIQDPEQFTARVEAIDAVDIVARVQGLLQRVTFEPGQAVAAGDLLFVIEPDQHEAELAAAEARVAQTEAVQREADRNLARTEQLADEQSVAQSVLDEAQAGAEMAAADVQSARAALRVAELNLSHTRITAPFDGQIGLNRYSVGTLVGPASGALARLIQLDPIRAVFSVPEATIVTLQQQTSDTGPRRGAFVPRLRLPNGSDYPHPGRIDYVANEVDPSTGTLPIRVAFPNPQHLLIPNQFVTLSMFDTEAPSLPVVPQSSVLQDREGRYVFLLRDDGTVTTRRIRTGVRVERGWAVTDGLEGGESVVTQGVQRLRDGMEVQTTTPR